MTWVDLPYIHSYDDRHGKQRVYYRRGRFRQAIKGAIGSSEFLEDYRRIHSAFEDQTPRRAQTGTFRSLVEEFYKSPRFGQLAERSKGEYRRHLDALSMKIGALPADAIEEAHILKWQAREGRGHRPSVVDHHPRIVISTASTFTPKAAAS